MKFDSNICRSYVRLKQIPNNPTDTATRSISPISQNDCNNRPNSQCLTFKTCSSNNRSRNVTPPEVTYNTANTLSSHRDQTPGACSNCHHLEKVLRISQRALLKLKDSQNSAEKHFKQYESLLKIKENRLNERESSLCERLKFLEIQEHKLSLDKSFNTLDSEKKTQATNRSISHTSGQRSLDSRFLDKKLEIPAKKNKSTETKGLTLSDEIKKLEQLHSIMKIKEEYVMNKEKELEKQKEILIEQMRLNEKLEQEVKSNAEKLSVKEKLLENKEKQVREDAEALKDKEKRLQEEETMLKERKEFYDLESKKCQESNESRIKGFDSLRMLSESRLSTENINRISPEKNLDVYADHFDQLSFGRNECIGSERNSEKSSLLESLRGSERSSLYNDRFILSRDPLTFTSDFEHPNKSSYISRDSRDEHSKLSIIEQIKARFEQKSVEHQHQLKLKDLFFSQEIEKFQSQIKELEESFEKLIEENRNLTSLNKSLQDKVDMLSEKNKLIGKEKGFDKLDEILDVLQEKLKIVIEKEAELAKQKKGLEYEHETVLNEAQCLKLLFMDLNTNKDEILEEKQELFEQKSAIMEIERRQNERNELVELKEIEVMRMKEELLKKQRIMRIKFKQTHMTMVNRGRTLNENSIDDSLVMNR